MAAGARILDSLYISGYGAAAASGSVSFYQPGTLVPIVVYSDDALATIQVQPIVLDAFGKTPLPVYTATPARAIIKSSVGTTLQDIERIDGDRAELVGVSNANWTGTDLNTVLTAIATSTGGANGQFKDSGVGAVVRTIQAKFSEIQVSVKDYGATGLGIADDTVAVQAAITRVIALGGGIVYFPAGTYLITSALSVTANGVAMVGASMTGSQITNTNATGIAVSITIGASNGATLLKNLTIAHSTSSNQTAISAVAGCILDSIVVTGHAISVTATAGSVISNNSRFTTSAASTSAALTLTNGTSNLFVGGLLNSVLGIGASIGSGTLTLIGTRTSTAPPVGVDVLAGASLYAYAVDLSSSATAGLRTAATASLVFHHACNWGAVTDGRTGAPVNYSFAGVGNMTPLPAQADTIRVVQATGGVVTTINNITALGFGRTFTLICSNTSAGASTFTFGASYVLSAAVTPAAGNRVNLLLTYDPVSGKTFEVGRGATAN